MIKLNEWNHLTEYKKGDIVIFYNKIYIANSDNVGILPPAVFDYEYVLDSLGLERLISTNSNSVLLLAQCYYPDLSSDQLKLHMNYNRIWLAAQ